jgi:hypothetical protein
MEVGGESGDRATSRCRSDANHPWGPSPLVRRGRGRRGGAVRSEDLLWGWSVRDIPITWHYRWAWDDRHSLDEAFRDGSVAMAEWPGRQPGESGPFIAGHTLVFGNDVSVRPNLFCAAVERLGRGEHLIRNVPGLYT